MPIKRKVIKLVLSGNTLSAVDSVTGLETDDAGVQGENEAVWLHADVPADWQDLTVRIRVVSLNGAYDESEDAKGNVIEMPLRQTSLVPGRLTVSLVGLEPDENGNYQIRKTADCKSLIVSASSIPLNPVSDSCPQDFESLKSEVQTGCVHTVTGSGGALITRSGTSVNVNVTGTGGDMLQANYAKGDPQNPNAVDVAKAAQSAQTGSVLEALISEKANFADVSAQAANLQTQINNIGNASPKGVYATISALQTAYPSGTSGIYVATADGKWYYWNGSAWTVGGTYQSTGIADGSVTRPQVKQEARAGYPFDSSADFLHDRGDGTLVSTYDIFIKYISDIRIYNAGQADQIYLWRVWNNSGNFQIDFKDGNGNIICQVKTPVSSLDFSTDKLSVLTINPYGAYFYSGYIVLNLHRITSTISITNFALTDTLLAQSTYKFIDGRYNFYPFANYVSIDAIRNCVKDVQIYGNKQHKYSLNYLRINYNTNSYILEIKDDTAGAVVSRIQSTNVFGAGIYTICLPEYNNSGVVSYVTVTVTDGMGINYMNIDTELMNACVYQRNYDITLPQNIPCVVNHELNIYSENILSNAFASQIPVILSAANGVNNLEKFTFQPAAAGTTVLTASAEEKGTYTITKRINLVAVDVNAGNGLTKKVLVIGDSKTDNPTKLAELLNLFASDAMKIELIGTIAENGTDANGGMRAVKNEGRSSWGIDNYYNQAGYNGMTNPFYNPSTGYFDFSYYMSNNGFPGVDYVFIDLGANDGGLDTATIKTCYDYIINSIHAYDSNIKIILSLQEGHCLREATVAQYQQNKIILDKIVVSLLSWYEGQESNNIYFCPQYVNMDLYNDFPLADAPLSGRNPTVVQKVLDYTHPSNYGYYKNADMYYYTIKYLASLS